MDAKNFIDQLNKKAIDNLEGLKKKSRIFNIIIYVIASVWIINFIVAAINFHSRFSNFATHFIIAFVLIMILFGLGFVSMRYKKAFYSMFDSTINKLIVKN